MVARFKHFGLIVLDLSFATGSLVMSSCSIEAEYVKVREHKHLPILNRSATGYLFDSGHKFDM
jgi:hypothetical protein